MMEAIDFLCRSPVPKTLVNRRPAHPGPPPTSDRVVMCASNKALERA